MHRTAMIMVIMTMIMITVMTTVMAMTMQMGIIIAMERMDTIMITPMAALILCNVWLGMWDLRTNATECKQQAQANSNDAL